MACSYVTNVISPADADSASSPTSASIRGGREQGTN